MGQAGIRCAVAGVGFLLLVSSIAKGFDVEETRATLRGLEGVCVVVDLTVGDKTDTGLQAAGLTANQLQTDVELRLRKAGIRVFTQQEALSMPGRPWLHVVVSVVKNQHFEFYASNITMEVRQNVYLTRAPDIIIPASTWAHPGELVTTGSSNLRLIRERMADITDGFINAYLSVNPEQAGRTRPPEPGRPSARKSTIRQAR